MNLLCPNCGTQHESGKFCPECGAKLQEVVPELVCSSCGYKAKIGKFCPECGTKLTEQFVDASIVVNKEPVKRTFNEKDSRFAKYYDKKGFPRTIPQEEYDVAIEELTPFVDQNIAEAKMLLGAIFMQDKNKDAFFRGVKLIKEAEEAGDMLAYYLMGFCYFYDCEPIVVQDHSEAEKRMLELYKKDEGEAASALAELYTFSPVKCDYKKAFDYATIAAEEDERSGYLVLGALYSKGLGVEKNVNLALENYKMAAAHGDETAMNQIGIIFMGEEGIEANPEQSFYWFNEASKKGADEEIMYNLGYCYKNGFGVNANSGKAIEWFKKSAELGNVDAMYELGYCYYYFLDEDDEAEKWYLKAAELGNVDAMCELGDYYDILAYYDEAKKWYLKAAELGNVYAMCELGDYYYDILKNYDEAKKWYFKAAELGNDGAMRQLGLYYYNILKNYDEAKKWYLKAAELGNVDAMYELGGYYEELDEEEEAKKWYLKAAELGNDGAMYKLGYYYEELDEEEAKKWYLKAAELGNVDAMCELGNYYEDLDEDEEAKKWYLKAAELGSVYAMYSLGLLHADKNDYKEAIKWYKKAMEQDYSYAYGNYAFCLWNGNGVKENKKEAMEMMQKAMSLGYPGAENNLKKMQQELANSKKEDEKKSQPKSKEVKGEKEAVIIENVNFSTDGRKTLFVEFECEYNQKWKEGNFVFGTYINNIPLESKFLYSGNGSQLSKKREKFRYEIESFNLNLQINKINNISFLLEARLVSCTGFMSSSQLSQIFKTSPLKASYKKELKLYYEFHFFHKNILEIR